MYYNQEHSIIFKRWCNALIITIFILGIVAGFVFKVEEERLYSIEEHFNWWLTIIIWISEIVPIAILYAVYSHLENQEIQIKLSGEIIDKLRLIELNTSNNEDIKELLLSDKAKKENVEKQNAEKQKDSLKDTQIKLSHTCSQCGTVFRVTYTKKDGQEILPKLSAICPKCNLKEIINK